MTFAIFLPKPCSLDGRFKKPYWCPTYTLRTMTYLYARTGRPRVSDARIRTADPIYLGM